ncbi:MAG: TVP38/TMEM64 family protein [Alphaproteobacteria bacterium]
MTEDAGTQATPKKFSIGKLLPIAVIVAAFAGFFALGLDSYVSFDALRDNKDALVDWVNRWGVLAYVIFALGYAAMITAVPPTGTVLTLVGGFLFGWLWGGLTVVFGATLGATALFLAARTAFADVLRDRAGGAVQKMREGFQEDAVSYMLFLRLVPAFPFFIVNIVPGLLGVKLRVYMLTTFFGIIPGTFVYAALGAGLGEFIDERDPDLGLIFEPQYLLPILGLAVLAMIPVILKRIRKKTA